MATVIHAPGVVPTAKKEIKNNNALTRPDWVNRVSESRRSVPASRKSQILY